MRLKETSFARKLLVHEERINNFKHDQTIHENNTFTASVKYIYRLVNRSSAHGPTVHLISGTQAHGGHDQWPTCAYCTVTPNKCCTILRFLSGT